MTNRQVVERYARALSEDDFDAQDALLHPDYQEKYPQSGEIIRGATNRRVILEQYPGRAESGAPVSMVKIAGLGEQWLPSPAPLGFGVMHVGGANDEFSIAGSIRYPDGQTWHLIALLTLRDGKIWRQTTYFAPPFDPPEWRSQLVDMQE